MHLSFFFLFCSRYDSGGRGGFAPNSGVPNGNNYDYVDPNARKSNSSNSLNVK